MLLRNADEPDEEEDFCAYTINRGSSLVKAILRNLFYPAENTHSSGGVYAINRIPGIQSKIEITGFITSNISRRSF